MLTPSLADADQHAGGVAGAALTAALGAVTEAEEELGRLDAVAADGDHGQGIVRGMRAAVVAARAEPTKGPGTTLLSAGTALADAAGGASGALFGVLLTEIGGHLTKKNDTSTGTLAEALTTAQDAVSELGGARPGDKTMVDALDAFTRALREAAGRGDTVAHAWRTAAEAASEAARSTAEMDPRIGRAARLGDRGRGSADPGATSLALMLVAAGDAVAEHCGGRNA